MVSVATYEIVYVLDDATTVLRQRVGAPGPVAMHADRPKRAVFAVRYFPSKKAWRAYDLRRFRKMSIFTGKEVMTAPKPTIETADRDAAIMGAVLHL